MKWRQIPGIGALALTLCGTFASEQGLQAPAEKSQWAEALSHRSQWPAKVRLLRAASFDIILGGIKKGSIMLPEGTAVDLRGVNGELLQVSANGVSGSVHYTATDLLSLIAPPVSEPTPEVVGTFAVQPPFQLLPFGDIKPGGWIREQMLRDITSGNSSYLEKMRPLGAPIASVAKRGYGEFEGNFADAVIRNAILTGYQPWLDRAKGIADFIVDQQDEKGYVGRKRPGDFEDLAESEGELWGQCCFLRAFLAYYEFSKEKKYLDSAIKSVDFLMSVFGEEKNKYFVGESSLEGGARAHGLMYVDVLEKLHQLTGERKYLDFAFRLYEDYSSSPNLKNTDHQLASLLDKDSLFVLHAPHVAEHARVVYWLATESKDPRYKEAAVNSMAKMQASLSPSGGLVTDDKMLECVGGKRGSADLRYEYCSITEAAISWESAFQKFGESRMADTVENIVFNAAQAARFSNGKANAYCSKDNQSSAAGVPDNASFRFQYAACHRIACCVYNVNRVMPYYVSHMWLRANDALLAAFYGPSVVKTPVNGVDVEIRENTLYPFENDVEMEVNPAREAKFDILLRIPPWSTKTGVVSEGAQQTRREGYVKLTKIWSKGDKIKITFTPEVEVKTTHDNESYVKRGALLYALKFDDIRTPTEKWEESDFANYDVRLADKADAKKFADCKLPSGNSPVSGAFVYSRNEEASSQFPFDKPYGVIKTKFRLDDRDVEDVLVPIGSTVLRKTSFGG